MLEDLCPPSPNWYDKNYIFYIVKCDKVKEEDTCSAADAPSKQMSGCEFAESACWLGVESDAPFGWPHWLPGVRHTIYNKIS